MRVVEIASVKNNNLPIFVINIIAADDFGNEKAWASRDMFSFYPDAPNVLPL